MTSSKTQASLIDRRRFLDYTWGGVGASLSLALLPGQRTLLARRASATTRSRSASPPAIRPPDGIVLWTRLAPEPANPDAPRPRARSRWAGGSRPTAACATSSRAASRSRRPSSRTRCTSRSTACGRAATTSTSSTCAARRARVGHFRTAPGASRDACGELRFAFATCQDWPSGYYTAYRDMLQNDLDLVLHLGDYTYEYAHRRRHGPRHPGARGLRGRDASDLRTYRLRHTLYKLDPDLQAAHAKFPFAVIWDDHEVQNDYSGLAPEWGSPSPEFTARRAAAYQAYYEHMPIRLSRRAAAAARAAHLSPAALRPLAEFTMLDDRQYRTDNPCGDGESLRCDGGARRRLHDARPRAGAVGRRGLRALVGALEHRRPAAAARRARAHCPYADELVLERRLGRLSAGAPAAARRRRRHRRCATPCSSPATGTRRSSTT